MYQFLLNLYKQNSDWLAEPFMLAFLAYSMIASGVIYFAFAFLVKMPAAYGRFADVFQTSLTINPKIGWIIQEAPSFLIAAFYLLKAEIQLFPSISRNEVLLMLFAVHYFHRSFIFPLFTKPKRQNPIITHLLGLIFCTWNGYLQGASLATKNISSNSTIYYLGLALFCIGAFINIKSDYYLISLRSKRDKITRSMNEKTTSKEEKKKGSDYIMPEGGIFQFVSCPNYFGETAEWLGFAIASGNLEQWAFAIFTFANLAPRAVQYHQFYHSRFKNYPRDRKAYIPFIW